MSTIVYGLFDDQQSAERALQSAKDSLAQVHHAVDGVVHTGHLREEDVQIGGSDALKGGIMGGLVVGIGGALIATFAIWPFAGYFFGLETLVFMVVAGSLFGVVAGAVAGASECKEAIRGTAREVRRGRSLVTLDVEHRADVARLRESLSASGGTQVKAA